VNADERLTQVLADFSQRLLGDYAVDDALQQVAEAAVDVLPVEVAGVSLADRQDQLRFAATSHVSTDLYDEAIRHLGHLQTTIGDRPSRDAYRTNEPVVVPDLTDAPDWPAFCGALLAAGFRGAAGFPLAVEDQQLGSLDVYSTGRLELDEHDHTVARRLADVATGYIMGSRRQTTADERPTALRHALSHPAIVEQAKGVLAGRHGISIDGALRAMLEDARRNGSPLRALARAIVEDGLDPLDDQPTGR
jgi:GAF domain-containing protein